MKVALLLFLLTATAQAQTDSQNFEAAGLLSGTFLRRIGSSDAGIGTSAVGIGGRVVYRALPHIDFESEAILWPNNQASSGTWIEGLAGVKVGERFNKFGIFAKVRPGFLYFRKDPFGKTAPGGSSFNPHWASSTEPALDLGGVLEYYTARNLIVRFDLGNTLLKYGRRDVIESPALTPVSRGGFTTQNWQGSLGVAFRF